MALLLCSTVTLPASSAEARFDPDLSTALARLDRAKGAEAYAALRRIWATWMRADPRHVEEALILAASSRRLSPGARAYAGTLAAYARLRRGDLKAAQQQLLALGYVDRWLVTGPFDNEGKTGLSATLGPETDLKDPALWLKTYSGKERPVRWRSLPDAFLYGFLDVGAVVRPEAKICAFAATVVFGPETRQARQVSAWVGSGGAFQLFWNGQERFRHEVYSSHDFDRIAVPLRLEPGKNLLVLKVCGENDAPVVSVRLADARGAPAAGLRFSNDLEDARQAAELGAQVAEHKAPRAPPTVEGPVQYFDRITARDAVTPAELEAYARYLRDTDGDDPATHLGRDLAKRAAERAPTLERCLLAGDLSEDRNQAGEWITKAEQLMSTDAPDRDVLLARAWHRRHSPNFRDALPYFDAVLRLDPTNVEALRGRLELYNLAGLPRTGLFTIERAVERSPHSVGLLGLYAAQLRTLGRSREASEIEARYHGLRFDDGGYLASQIELSLARSSRSSAERWAERLLAVQPHDSWALETTARAYKRLGQPERAIATYRRALALAPEDVGTMRSLADLYGQLGERDQQLSLLRKLLAIRPQDRDVRQYVQHLKPDRARPDEAYAWKPAKFLHLRHAPPAGQNRRTLRDLTVSTVFENGLSSQFRQVVFQPLTDASAAQDRQYVFAYEADRQTVQLRGAKVYRKSGRVDEAIEWGEGPADDPTISMYTSARAFYVQFPRLEAGDVVELRYRIDDVTPRNEFADYFGEVVYLQDVDPTFNAEYVLITPKSRKLYIDARVPGLKRTERDKGAQRTYDFFAERVPALAIEPAMPPLQELLGFVHVSTYSSWTDLGRWYWGLIQDQFDLDDETRQLAQKIAADKKTEREKVAAVYDWVINNTRYVALEFGIYGYKPRRCVQTVARGWGDCKDKATVIVTLLKELGIEATLVVVRTQLRGDFPSQLASFAPFDHAIAYVPSLDLYLDGTAEHTGITELPRMDLGALGLHVSDKGAKLHRLPPADPNKNFVERSVEARLGRNGEARIKLSYQTGGFVSAEWRRRYHAESALRDRVNSDLGNEYPGFEIAAGAQGIVTSDLDDASVPVRIAVQGKAPTFARREGADLSMAVTTSLRLTPTYASLSKRTQDVWTQGFSTTEDLVSVELPPGAEVVSAPVSKHGKGPFGSYLVEVTTDKRKVVIRSRIEIDVGRIKPSDYGAFRRFCEEADQAMSPRLVVRP